MRIQSEISKSDYSKLMTINLLKTPYMIIIVIMGWGLLIFYFLNPELGQFYLFLGLGFIGIPLLTYLTIGQAYERNKHFNEHIEFVIEQNNLELIGRTFRSSFTWDQITKVKESDKFFSLYQGRILLTALSTKDSSKETVDQLRKFFKDKGKI